MNSLKLKWFIIVGLIVFLSYIACNSDRKISQLLISKNKDDLILGANKAGASGKRKFVPLLLNNAMDPRMSTNFDFKGVTVYQAKMEALAIIFMEVPGVAINENPDSIVFKFYDSLYRK